MRVVLDGMPQMLREMLKDIMASDPSCRIVAEEVEEADLGAALAAMPADVVILAIPQAEAAAGRFDRLLAQHPATRIIAIAASGDRALHYELRPHLTPIEDLSPATLLGLIRQPPSHGGRR